MFQFVFTELAFRLRSSLEQPQPWHTVILTRPTVVPVILPVLVRVRRRTFHLQEVNKKTNSLKNHKVSLKTISINNCAHSVRRRRRYLRRSVLLFRPGHSDFDGTVVSVMVMMLIVNRWLVSGVCKPQVRFACVHVVTYTLITSCVPRHMFLHFVSIALELKQTYFLRIIKFSKYLSNICAHH